MQEAVNDQNNNNQKKCYSPQYLDLWISQRTIATYLILSGKVPCISGSAIKILANRSQVANFTFLNISQKW